MTDPAAQIRNDSQGHRHTRGFFNYLDGSAASSLYRNGRVLIHRTRTAMMETCRA